MIAVRRLLRRSYNALPGGVLLALRTVLRPKGAKESPFLQRLAVPYEKAVYQFGPDHWEEKLLRVGCAGLGAVLDLGCGPGQWLRPLAKHNGAVVGVDVSPALLEHAQREIRSHPKIALVQARAEALCFREAVFDAVLCYSVLMYTDHERALCEAARVLKPGGKLVLGLVGLGYYLKHVVEGARFNRLDLVRYGVEPIATRLGQTLVGRRSLGVTYWSNRRIRRALRRHGFQVRHVFPERKDPTWPESYLGASFYFFVEASKRWGSTSASRPGSFSP